MHRILGASPVSPLSNFGRNAVALAQRAKPRLLLLQTSLDSHSLGSDDIGQKTLAGEGICGEYRRGSAYRFAPPRC